MPNLSLSPIPASYDIVYSAPQSFTVTNIGRGDARNIQFIWSLANTFSVNSSTCIGKTLSPGESCTFTLSFIGVCPPEGGVLFDSNLTVSSGSTSPVLPSITFNCETVPID